MPPLLKNFLKSTILGFAVGALASALLTPIAGMIFPPDQVAGVVGKLANPMWLGGFVAALNGVTTLATPAIDGLFGDRSTLTEPPAKAEDKEPAVTLYLNQEPEISAEIAPEKGDCCKRLDAERTLKTAGVSLGK